MFRRLTAAGLFVLACGSVAGAQTPTKPDPPEYPEIAGTVETTARGVHRVVRIPVDRTGVVDWRFLNPRRPHRVCVYVGPDGKCAASGTEVMLRFENQSSTRTIVIEFSYISDKLKAAVEAAGLTNLDCVAGKCEAVRHVGSGLAPLEIPVKALQAAYVPEKPSEANKATRIQFRVSLFEEETDVANPVGSFTLVDRKSTGERSDPAKWSTSATADALWGPDLSALVPTCTTGKDCAKDPVIAVGSVREDAQEESFSGTVRLGLTQTMGDRARAEAEIQLKKGTFGAEDGSVQVTATKYRVYVFAANGATFSGGRYTFAAPSQAIAVNEIGEGITVAWKRAEFSHIFKKEVPDDRIRRALTGLAPGDAALGEGDHHASVLQVRDIRFTDGGSIRLNLLGLLGQHEVRGLEYDYSTVGGELFLGFTHNVSGAFAAYRSSRSATMAHDGADADQDGSVWLGSLSYTRFLPELTAEEVQMLESNKTPAALTKSRKQRLDYTLTATVGSGSGDDGSTDEREDFIGQTSNFAPDVLFLGSLAQYIKPGAGEGSVGKGLANKLYLQAAYNHHHFSPLRYVARLFRVADDVESEGTAIRFHHYRFNERVFDGRSAGNELDIEFRIESPKGVKYKVTLAVYKPGSALEGIIREVQYAAIGNVSVRF